MKQPQEPLPCAPSARARKPIPSEIRSRVNRIAHAAAQKHEAEVRARLLADLQRMASEGADLRQLNDHLESKA